MMLLKVSGKWAAFSSSTFAPVIVTGTFVLLVLLALMFLFGVFSDPRKKACSLLERVKHEAKECRKLRNKKSKSSKAKITECIDHAIVYAQKSQRYIDTYLYHHPNDVPAKLFASHRKKISNSAEAVGNLLDNDKACTMLLDNIIKQCDEAVEAIKPEKGE